MLEQCLTIYMDHFYNSLDTKFLTMIINLNSKLFLEKKNGFMITVLKYGLQEQHLKTKYRYKQIYSYTKYFFNAR